MTTTTYRGYSLVPCSQCGPEHRCHRGWHIFHAWGPRDRYSSRTAAEAEIDAWISVDPRMRDLQEAAR